MEKNSKKIGITTLQLTLAVILSACTGGSESTKIVISDTCSLDNVIGSSGNPPNFITIANADIELQGWIADSANGRIPKKINVELVNSKNQVKHIESGTVGIKRTDVATALKLTSVEDSGFSIKTKLQGVISGEYEILLSAIYDDQMTICSPHRKIIIK